MEAGEGDVEFGDATVLMMLLRRLVLHLTGCERLGPDYT
jgi:hypothetical protein